MPLNRDRYLAVGPAGQSLPPIAVTDAVVHEGSFTSVADLVTAINVHLAYHNLRPTPYRWKAQGAAILEKIQRARAAQNKIVL